MRGHKVLVLGSDGLPEEDDWLANWAAGVRVVLVTAGASPRRSYPVVAESLTKPVDRSQLLDVLERLTLLVSMVSIVLS